jgi:large subunit ribosomal protein L35
MGYKFKPNKGVAKRMKVSASGKLKHRHEKLSHLRSRRNSALKRRLGRPGVLAEGHSRNMRKFLGIVGKRPNQAAHEKALAAKAAEQKTAEAK